MKKTLMAPAQILLIFGFFLCTKVYSYTDVSGSCEPGYRWSGTPTYTNPSGHGSSYLDDHPLFLENYIKYLKCESKLVLRKKKLYSELDKHFYGIKEKNNTAREKADEKKEIIESDIQDMMDDKYNSEKEIIGIEEKISNENENAKALSQGTETAIIDIAILEKRRSEAEVELEKKNYEAKVLNDLYIEISKLNDNILRIAGVSLSLNEKPVSYQSKTGYRISSIEKSDIDQEDAQTSFKKVKDSAKKALNAHDEWLQSFNEHVENNKPNFKNITDSKTFSDAITAIYHFKTSMPDQDSAANFEKELVKNITLSLIELDELSNQAFQLFNKGGIGVLQEKNKIKIEKSLLRLQESIIETGIKLAQLHTSVDNRAYSRNRMKNFTILAWTELAEKMLIRSNVTQGQSIIKEALVALNEGTMQAQIEANINERINAYNVLYKSYQSPNLARRQAYIALGEISNILKQKEELMVSNSTRVEIEASLFDLKEDIRSDISDMQYDIENRESLKPQRQYFVNRILGAYSDSMSVQCIEIAENIVSAKKIQSRVEEEQLFVEFSKECRP